MTARQIGIAAALIGICAAGTAGEAAPKKSLRVRATAYHSSCRACATGGKTATGRSAHSRGVAADPRVFPIGTVLYIPGYGNARVDDTGGAIKGRRIDVRLGSHLATRSWGVRNLNVRVVSKPKKKSK